jgi:hypothetical protein
MKKTILAIATCAVLVVATLAPTTADARWRGSGAAGVFGGIVLGTILGASIASHPGYYRYEYDRPPPPGCYWARRAWRDQYGRVHYGRPRYFCD